MGDGDSEVIRIVIGYLMERDYLFEVKNKTRDISVDQIGVTGNIGFLYLSIPINTKIYIALCLI